jgi:hypothetical protein
MPRLIVPSSGGGTKLMRTLLVGDAEGLCSGVGEGVGLGVSCANATQADVRAIRMTALTLFVMSGGVATSLVVGPEKAKET